MKAKKETSVTKNIKLPKLTKEKNVLANGAHTHIITIIVAVLALVISIFSYMKNVGVGSGDDCQYKIYIGLTDSDANYQMVDEITAKELIKTVCLAKSVAYTIYEADGGFKDNEGKIHVEKSYILEMDHITDNDLYSIMDDIILRLNCGAVMYTKNNMNIVKYTAKNKK